MSLQRATSLEGLPGPRRASWILPAAAIAVFFYACLTAAIFLLVVTAAGEFILACAGGRSPWARRLRRVLQAHFHLLKILCRSLRRERAREARVALSREHAPELFLTLERLCEDERIPPPALVLLEMSANAWLRIQGGRVTVLGLGLDLLAGLNRDELETVLAHELIHAHSSAPRLRHWLANASERMASLVRALSARARRPLPARIALGLTRTLLARLTHLMSAASREEELRADCGAAERCGIAPTCAALIRVESLRRAVGRVSWRERLAQFQACSFTVWLERELSQIQPLTWPEIAAEIPDPHSTHPTLRERLLALGRNAPGAPAADSAPALQWLAQPAATAEELMRAIQQRIVLEEENDTRELRRWARQMRAARRLSPAQVAGGALVFLAELFGALAVWRGASLSAAGLILAAAFLGLTIFWLGKFREGFVFPEPDFALLKTTWPPDAHVRERHQGAKATALRPPDRPAANLDAKARSTLAECDYGRAFAIGRRALQSAESVSSLLVVAVAAAWLGESQESARCLAAVQRLAGLRGPSICWGAAWAFMLRGNWSRGEALLQEALDTRPQDATLLNLRALCQWRRGKIQSAIVNARRACQPRPRNLEHAKFLIELLLEGGYVDEAAVRLSALDNSISDDDELILATIRLHLLQGRHESARHWSGVLLGRTPPPFVLVRLAVFHELARLLDDAEQLYRKALSVAYYPDAWLGLARLAAARNQAAQARQHTLQALNLRQTLGPYATPPMELIGPILSQLAALEPRAALCRGWVAELAADAIPGAAASMSFLVYAASEERAQVYFDTIVSSMAAAGSVTIKPRVLWRVAPVEYQPIGPVRPGVRPLSDGLNAILLRRGFRRLHFAGPEIALSC